MDHVVIIGAGQAGCQLADSLRREGHDGPITLVGEEEEAPYQRPPLSKAFLLDEMDEARLPLRPYAFYEQRNIITRFGTRVESINKESKAITLDTGEALSYDKLALCIGTRVRIPPLPGVDQPHIRSLRTLRDSHALKRDLRRANSVAVIGGGFIGLEVAASARKQGKQVTIIEALDRVMKRAVSEPVSRYFEQLHTNKGSALRLNARVETIGTNTITLATGEEVPADLVVLGTGVNPCDDIAFAAGIACDNGIIVDEYCRTSDPDIIAAGDCANHPNYLTGERLRLESVQNAIDEAKIAAKTLTGTLEHYKAVPWFWSDQFEIKLQMAGLSANTDEAVIRGDMRQNSFSLFYFKEGVLMAADSINAPADHMAARKILSQDDRSLTPQEAGDPDFDLKLAF